MSSSTGSDIFLGLALLSIFLAVLLVLRHYLPLRTTPAYLLVPVFLALALPASIILLVPIDLASSAVPEDGENRGIWLPDEAMLLLWRVTYWLTFALTWLVLPLLGDYADAGYRDPKGRILYSLRSNAKYYAIVILCSVAGIVYFFVTSGIRITSIKALVMALAYAWGLILAISLMGHGLVAIPRQLFSNARPAKRLRNLESRAPFVHEKLQESMEQLEQLEAEVLELEKKKNGTAPDFKEWIEDLADTSDLPPARVAQSQHMPRSAPIEVITVGYLADLTRKLKRARHKRIRFEEEWMRLVQAAQETRAIMDASGSKKLDFGRASPAASYLARLKLLNPYTRYHLHAHIVPASRIFLAACLAAASLCIIWTEVMGAIVPQLSIIGLSVIHHPNSEDGKIGFAGQLMSACWLLYMCTAALMSVREVKVWGNRALVRRHTYAESACWYACQVAKLTVPLSYNFITCFPSEIYEDTEFYNFLGILIDLTPLGLGFSRFFPIFILLPVLATTFNLYGKIKNVAGFGVIEDDVDENPDGIGTGSWREGRSLIERELMASRASGDGMGLRQTTRTQSPRIGSVANGASSGAGVGASSSSSSAAAQARTPLLPILGYSSPANASPRVGSPALRQGGGAQPASASTRYPDSSSATTRGSRAANNSRRPPREEDLDDTAGEENFFTDFAHRVRNTFEVADRPSWVPKVNINRPKWMGGVDGNTESSSRADFGRGLGRWFGGRPEDRQVRL